MVDQFAAILGTAIGESIFLTIFGMAFVSLRRKPNDPPIPSYSEGGGFSYSCWPGALHLPAH
jgi:hypothetical protein